MGDGRVKEHAVTAKFHGDRDITCRSNASIAHNRYLGSLQDDAEIVRVKNPLPTTDRTARGHHASSSGRLQSLGHHRIVRRVAEDGETIFCECFRRAKGFHRIGQKGLFIRQDLKFDQIRFKDVAR